MARFKIGDRVRLVKIDGDCGLWNDKYVGEEGIVLEKDTDPYVNFDSGEDWGSENYLEPAEQPKKDESAPKTETQPMVVNISIGAELTNITIGGKRFRLVPEA